MQIIKPSVEILDEIDGQAILRKLERIGRVCYQSGDKITEDSAAALIERIIRSGHESVIEHVSVTVKFICDRGVSHEIVRHRIASYTQESTRYCNYTDGLMFVIPSWLDLPEGRVKKELLFWVSTQEIDFDSEEDFWLHAMWDAEQRYLMAGRRDWTPQEARSVLPNSLKTELIMTANLREWRHFLRLRTAPAAHPQLRELACQLLDQMRSAIPVIFDDI